MKIDKTRVKCGIIVYPSVSGRCAAHVGRSKNSCPYGHNTLSRMLWERAYDQRIKEGPADFELYSILAKRGLV